MLRDASIDGLGSLLRVWSLARGFPFGRQGLRGWLLWDDILRGMLTIFPSPAEMSLIKLSLAGNNLIFFRQGEFVISWLGTGKSLTFFYSA